MSLRFVAAVVTLSCLAGPAAAQAVEQPAETHTEPRTGAQLVTVPEGCTTSTRPNGQLVIHCPFAAPAPPPAPTHYERTWYGWQTLLVDGAALAVGLPFVAASESTRKVGLGVLATGFAFGAPIVHVTHGNVGRGVASFFIRVGAPSSLGVVTWFLGSLRCWTCASATAHEQAIAASVGVAAGAAVAIALDGALFARDRKLVPDVPETRSALQWLPLASYDPSRRAGTVGIRGAF